MKSYACYPGARHHMMRNRFSNPNTFPYSAWTSNPVSSKAPATNIRKTETGYVIEMAVPGLNKEDIQIEVYQNELTISHRAGEKEDKINFTRREFDHQGFKRTFRLQQHANTEAIEASFDNGILTIAVPTLAPQTAKVDIS